VLAARSKRIEAEASGVNPSLGFFAQQIRRRFVDHPWFLEKA
jgi:hypothetical protein